MKKSELIIRAGFALACIIMFMYVCIESKLVSRYKRELAKIKQNALDNGVAYETTDINGVKRLYLRDLNKDRSSNVKIDDNGFVRYKHSDYTWEHTKHPAIEYDEEIPFTYSNNSDIVRLKIAARKVDDKFEQVIKRIHELEQIKIKQISKKGSK